MLAFVLGIVVGVASVTTILQAKKETDAPSSPQEPCIQPDSSARPSKGV